LKKRQADDIFTKTLAMSKDFEWKIDEKPAEGEIPLYGIRHGQILSGRTNQVLLAKILVIIATISVVSFATLQRRASEAVNQARVDIVASNLLIDQAQAKSDYDLLEVLTSNSDPEWQELQLKFLDNHATLDQMALGLVAKTGASGGRMDDTLQVVVSPDLTSAESTFLQPYESLMGNRETETVHLEVTRKFIREGNSWLLAPIGSDNVYWGRWEKEEFDQLILIYPAKDSEIGQRLAPDLNRLIAEICDDPGVQCPKNFALQLRLDRNERSLPILNEHFGDIGGGTSLSPFTLNLPTPTLIGRPVDEAGYQAIYSGYAGWVVAAIANRFGVFEIGKTHESLNEFLAKWDLQLPPEPPMTLPRPALTALPKSIPAPQEDILLLCVDASRSRLLRYHPSEGTWTDELQGVPTPAFAQEELFLSEAILSSLPDHSATLIRVSQMTEDGAQSRIYLWNDGKETLLVDSDMAYSFSPTQLEHYAGLNAQSVFLHELANVNNETHFTLSILDVSSCSDWPCELQTLVSYPIWSLDKSYARISTVGGEDDPSNIFLGNKTGELLIDIGPAYFLFWIDNLRYGFIRPASVSEEGDVDLSAGTEVVLTSLALDPDSKINNHIVLDSEMLLAALPEQDRPDQLAILNVLVHPTLPDMWIVSASDDPDLEQRNDFIFTFELNLGRISLIENLALDKLAYVPEITRDGRYLSWATSEQSAFRLHIYDFETQNTLDIDGVFRQYSWSLNNEWLLLTGGNGLRLVSPGHEYEHLVSRDLPSCHSATWVEAN
jgi:hypothetical protein